MALGNRWLRSAILLCGVAVPAQAQQTALGPTIIVNGERPSRGARSERVLTAEDIETYGASRVGELIDALAAERGESADDLVYLVNGRRVIGLRGIDDYPVEALERVEILARGAAPRAGGLAGKRVVSLVLKSEVQTYVGRATFGAASDGKAGSRGADVSWTDIRGSRRINLALSNDSQAALTEFDRNIEQEAGAPPGRARARTLRPDVEKLQLKFSAVGEFDERSGGELNVRLLRDRTAIGLGLGSDGRRLRQRLARSGGEAEIQLNREVGDWLVTLAGTYAEDRRITRTDWSSDAIADLEPTRTVSRIRDMGAELNANGPEFELPAGLLDLRLRARLARNAVSGNGDDFAQTSAELAAGVHLPIASAAAGVLPWLGELSAGLELSASRVSRLGTLTSATYSLQWQPAQWIRLAGSVTAGRTPPSVELVAGPIVATPGVRYVDPISGETVDVVELTGGNSGLGAQRTQDRQLSLNLKPLRSVPLLLTADYSASRNRDIIASLPSATELLLRAFPERFGRDAGGVLTQVDSRPIAFSRRSEEQLRYGIDLDLPFGGGSRGSRLQVNLAHTLLLNSTLALRSGFAPVDLLSRNALGLGGSSRPRHLYDFSVGYAERGLGLRLVGQRRGVSYLDLGERDEDALRFAPLTILTVRGFVDAQRLLPALHAIGGLRLSLTVSNLTNARQRVRNALGETPLRYQPGYLDSVGRSVQLELRKAF